MFHFSSSPCFIPVVRCRQFSVTLLMYFSCKASSAFGELLFQWPAFAPVRAFFFTLPFPPSVQDHSYIFHPLWHQLPDSPWTAWRVSMTLTLHLALHGLHTWVLLSKTYTAGVVMCLEFSVMHRNLNAGIKGGLEKWASYPCLGNLTWTMTLASLHFPYGLLSFSYSFQA